VVRRLQAEGIELELVNGGGTGSLEVTAQDPSVTEATAGSGLLTPTLFDGYDAFQHHAAAGFVLPVTRKPRPGVVTCHGGGLVASGSAGPDRLPRPVFPTGLSLTSREGAGEVQTPLVGPGAAQLAVGDPVFFRHAKSGELMEHFNEVVMIHGDAITVEPTYRGMGQCFL
jgi:D-serine deaminase-like pyridoxal phosphate-dependent protein